MLRREERKSTNQIKTWVKCLNKAQRIDHKRTLSRSLEWSPLSPPSFSVSKKFKASERESMTCIPTNTNYKVSSNPTTSYPNSDRSIILILPAFCRRWIQKLSSRIGALQEVRSRLIPSSTTAPCCRSETSKTRSLMRVLGAPTCLDFTPSRIHSIAFRLPSVSLIPKGTQELEGRNLGDHAHVPQKEIQQIIWFFNLKFG